MQLELFHFSLMARPTDLLSPLLGAPPTREAWLRIVFSRHIVFRHRGQELHYAPQAKWETGRPGIIVGKIGKRRFSQENAPPEEALEDIERAQWKAAITLLDPGHHEDGQKFALEHNAFVGKPVPILQSLVEQINKTYAEEFYILQYAPISDQKSFWDFVDTYGPAIRQVDFAFIAPNMLINPDDFEKELKDMRDKENVRSARLVLENNEGLSLKTKRIKGAVEYASKGGGVIKAETRSGAKYNSKRRTKRVNVPQKKKERFKILDLIKSAIDLIF